MELQSHTAGKVSGYGLEEGLGQRRCSPCPLYQFALLLYLSQGSDGSCSARYIYIQALVMKTSIFLLIFVLLLSYRAEAQQELTAGQISTLKQIQANNPKLDTVRKVVLGQASYRVRYKRVHQSISGKRDLRGYRPQVLLIGDRLTWYGNEGHLAADSVWDQEVRAGKDLLSFYTQYTKASGAYPAESIVIQDRRKDSLFFFDRIFVDRYRYDEPIPHQSWQLTSGDSVVAGYKCHRAVTRWRGRDWVAWYSEELPMSYGPYKFGGLPGLILCLYDATGDYRYTMEAMEHLSQPKNIYYKPSKNIFRTHRKEYHRAYKYYTEHSNDYRSNKITKREGVVARRALPYNPVELE